MIRKAGEGEEEAGRNHEAGKEGRRQKEKEEEEREGLTEAGQVREGKG